MVPGLRSSTSAAAWGTTSRCVLSRRAVSGRHIKRVAFKTVERAVCTWQRQRIAAARISHGDSACKFQPVTLFEICCSSKSTTSRHVTENGGAAVRVLWPPPYLPKLARNLQKDVPSRAVQTALLPSLKLPSAGARPQTWCLNMDWPVHRKALLHQLRTALPASGTTKLALLTSPQCRMFAIPQRLQHAQGIFNWQAHGVAMKRLHSMRAFHHAMRKRRIDAGVCVACIHEQPPGSSTNLLKKYDEPNDFPWAIGRGSMRRTVHGCMCGSVSQSDELVYKGWRFEVDAPQLAAALDHHRCDWRHTHAMTSMNMRAKKRPHSQPLLRVSDYEVYPPYLGSLLCAAMFVQ